jgi:hypothetical protein
MNLILIVNFLIYMMQFLIHSDHGRFERIIFNYLYTGTKTVSIYSFNQRFERIVFNNLYLGTKISSIYSLTNTYQV